MKKINPKLNITVSAIELPVFTLMFLAIFFVFLTRTIKVAVAFPRFRETLGTIFALKFVRFAFRIRISRTIQLIGTISTILFQITLPFIGNTLTIMAPKLIRSTSGVSAILIRAIRTIFIKVTFPLFRYTFGSIQAHEFIGSTL